MRKYVVTPLDVRFYRYVPARMPDSCWRWTGAHTLDGYGVITTGTKGNQSNLRAHRVSWQIAFGPIPEGKSVLHRCDVRDCVNPDHLFLGTRADNVRDMDAKGRRIGAGAVGEANAAHKLTAQDIPVIRAALATGRTQAEVARWFKVDRTMIGLIARRRAWAHVP